MLRRLTEAGLGGVPGGGAEILDDEIRAIVSPKKTKTAAWLRVMEIAHELGLYTSASQVFGFGEQPVFRVRALEALRETLVGSEPGLEGLDFLDGGASRLGIGPETCFGLSRFQRGQALGLGGKVKESLEVR